jgi:hypothetical protein
VAHGLENPDLWDREWVKTKVATPDQATRAHAANVIALNGERSLDAFVVALALENGKLKTCA